MPFIYMLVNPGMPELVKFIYTNVSISELLYELDKRTLCIFEPPYQYTVACYIEVLDETSSSRLFISMNKCNFIRLRDNFYNIGNKLDTVINLFKQLSQYEQLILDEIHKKSSDIPYKKLTLYIDNIYTKREIYVDESDISHTNEHQPRKPIEYTTNHIKHNSMLNTLSNTLSNKLV